MSVKSTRRVRNLVKLFFLFCFSCFSTALSSQASPLLAKVASDEIVSQTDTFCGKAFFKRLFIPGQSSAGHQIVPAPGGNFFLAAAVGERTMIALADRRMELIWVQSIDMGLGAESILNMRLDSEGNLVAVGNTSLLPIECFAFKMNAANGQLIWLSKLNDPGNSYFTKILEKNGGANYLLFGQTDLVDAGNNSGCDALLMEIDRNTGELLWDRQYDLGSCEIVNDVFIENNQIYVCGRYNLVDGGQSRFRPAISRFDIAGNLQWSRHYLRNGNQDATMYFNRLTHENDSIVAFGWGNDAGTSLTTTTFQLVKTDLTGAAKWAKKYDIAGGSEERSTKLFSVPDGYLMFGTFSRSTTSREICLIKTDKQGNLLWGKSYGAAGEDRLSDAILVADTIYLIGSRQNAQIFDILVGKLDLNGEVDGQCNFVKSLDVTVSDYGAPLDFSHNLEEIDITHNYATAALPAQTMENNIAAEVICQKICAGCDTVYLAQTIEFCSGDFVQIGGEEYTQPGMVLDTIPGTGTDCDTVVTYTLQFYQNSIFEIQCPANVTVEAVSGTNAAIVYYNPPTANTDCSCGPAMVELQQGLASGSDFPVGVTQVCYVASDACNDSNSCCFSVTVQAAPPEEACDVKITTCVKFEILGISQNPTKQRTYRMRVTNSCANKLIYTTFQLPNGIVADVPANNSTYTAPGGRQYEVRNPNFSPASSIRFKAIGDGIANGQSDIFEYTLPPQSEPLYIYATAKLFPQVFAETHLNVFDCPVQQTANRPPSAIERQFVAAPDGMVIFPNPSSGVLNVRLPGWIKGQVQLRVTDAYGRLLHTQTSTAETEILLLELPVLPAGVYYLEAVSEQGERQTGRFLRAAQR